MDNETSLNNTILTLLADTNVPISYGWFNGTKQNNITFFEYLEQGSDYSDDEMVSEVHFFQIDIWGYSNIEALKKQVKTILLANDFILVDCKDLFEAEQKLFHKALRVRIENFVE